MPENKKATKQVHYSGLDHIHARPEMYIGSTKNANQLYREIRDNVNDQIINNKATEGWFTITKDGLKIRDNGEGLNPEVSELQIDYINKKIKMPQARQAVYTTNTGSHYEDDDSFSAGVHGIGSKTVNALSSEFEAKVWRDHKFYRDQFAYDQENHHAAQPITKLRPNGAYFEEDQNKENTPFDPSFNYHGTEIDFKPLDTIFDEPLFDFDYLVKDLTEIAYITHATYHIKDEVSGQEVTIQNHNTLEDFVKKILQKNELTQIGNIYNIKGKMQMDATQTESAARIEVEIAMTWTNDSQTIERGYTNTVFNEKNGTHIDGFNQGLSRLMNHYAKTLNISKDTIEARDLRAGLVAVISVKHTDAKYSSQIKEELVSANAKKALNQIIYNQGAFELDKNIQDVEKILKQALKRAEERKKFQDLSKINVNSKEARFRVSKKLKPGKWTYPQVPYSELFITEGDSASGGITNTRMQIKGVLSQAVYPVKGKVISAAKNTPDKVFANPEIQTITTALGTNFGSKFDLSKLKYNRIIIASDADSDGANIALLLLTFFMTYMPELIEQGYVYRAMTPLYENIFAKNEIVNTFTQVEQDQLLKKRKPKQVKRYKGLGEMDKEQIKTAMVDPRTRHLVQFTTKDFAQSTNTMDILMGKNVAPRREFFLENAQFGQALTD